MSKLIWEPQRERVKLDLRIPRDLHKQVHDLCLLLGIPKNAFFALGASFLLIQFAPLLGRKKIEGADRIAGAIIQKVTDSLCR